MRTCTFVLAVVLVVSVAGAQQTGADKFVRAANLIVDAIMSDNYETLEKEYTKDNRDALPLAKTEIFFRGTVNQYGKVRRIDPPKVVNTTQAIVAFYFDRSVQDLRLYLDPADKIDGFIFVPHVDSASAPPIQATAAPMSQPKAPVVPDKQQTDLYPPFTGTWIISSGGEAREGVAARNILTQQWSYEFTAVVNGATRKSDGKTNEDFYAFGKDVLAPADGIVTDVIDGIRDNAPGNSTNPYAPIGNTVIIQHKEREYSVFSYLKNGSIKVKVGDKVTRAQVIAQVGNSGRSSEPTLHYHLQNSPLLQNAQGVKFYFEKAKVTKDGKTDVELVHLPFIGDVIEP